MSSPRTWGCFFELIHKVIRDCVFPTHVGVFLIFFLSVALRKSLPHARGGVSRNHGGKSDNAQSSPRTWGCFPKPRSVRLPRRVFPTHVGVFLTKDRNGAFDVRLSHARGGVSTPYYFRKGMGLSSPRTWGCFYEDFVEFHIDGVFPTHVGVFLSFMISFLRFSSLPHARGGVSPVVKTSITVYVSSPRTWGCFFLEMRGVERAVVFPTHVGVFLKVKSWQKLLNRLPHARGGVSPEGYEEVPYVLSSPRTWGCFHTCLPLRYACLVFPTHVGVFLRTLGNSGIQCCLPHARGGVSITVLVYRFYLVSSPRTWGCFYTKRCIYATLIVFPTHVGVFLLSELPYPKDM